MVKIAPVRLYYTIHCNDPFWQLYIHVQSLLNNHLTRNFFTGPNQKIDREVAVAAIEEPQIPNTELSGDGRTRSNSMISQDGDGYLSPAIDDSHLHEIRLRPEPTWKQEVKVLFRNEKEVGVQSCFCLFL